MDTWKWHIFLRSSELPWPFQTLVLWLLWRMARQVLSDRGWPSKTGKTYRKPWFSPSNVGVSYEFISTNPMSPVISKIIQNEMISFVWRCWTSQRGDFKNESGTKKDVSAGRSSIQTWLCWRPTHAMIKPFTFTLNAMSCDVRRFRKCPQVQSGAWTHNGCISRSTQELHCEISMAPFREADGADGGGVDRWGPHWTSMVWSDFWGRTWQDNIWVWAKIEVPRDPTNPEHGSLSALHNP